MEEAITEAKRALVAEDRVANSDHYRGEWGERLHERQVHLARANAQATLAVAIGLERLLSHLEDRVTAVRNAD